MNKVDQIRTGISLKNLQAFLEEAERGITNLKKTRKESELTRTEFNKLRGFASKLGLTRRTDSFSASKQTVLNQTGQQLLEDMRKYKDLKIRAKLEVFNR